VHHASTNSQLQTINLRIIDIFCFINKQKKQQQHCLNLNSSHKDRHTHTQIMQQNRYKYNISRI